MMERIGRAMVGLTAVVVLAGCATTSSSTMGKDDAIAARQQLMKEQGAAMRAINEKLKANQVQAVAADAEKLAQTSARIPALFPQGSADPGKSRAKPEIWQKWADFEATAKRMNTQATELAAAARSGNAQATTAAVGQIGRTSCTGCHDAFRGPEIKK